jgi:hypothetical protein
MIASPPRPPSQDELEALIKEARERQLRRRLVRAAGVATAAALGLGVYALWGTGSPARSRSSSRTSSPAAGSVCRPSQLVTSVNFYGGIGSGGYFGGATIRNASGTTCILPRSAPSVQISWRGTPRLIRQTTFRPPDHRLVRLLRPGATAMIYMVWQNWCASAHLQVSRGGLALRPPTVIFTFGLGRALAVTAPFVGAPSCLGLPASTLMASRPRSLPS